MEIKSWFYTTTMGLCIVTDDYIHKNTPYKIIKSTSDEIILKIDDSEIMLNKNNVEKYYLPIYDFMLINLQNDSINV